VKVETAGRWPYLYTIYVPVADRFVITADAVELVRAMLIRRLPRAERDDRRASAKPAGGRKWGRPTFSPPKPEGLEFPPRCVARRSDRPPTAFCITFRPL